MFVVGSKPFGDLEKTTIRSNDPLADERITRINLLSAAIRYGYDRQELVKENFQRP